MKNKVRLKKIGVILSMEVYHFDCIISLGQTDEELIKILKAGKKDVSGEVDQWKFTCDTTVGRCCFFSNNVGMIRLRHFPEYPRDYGTLTHEIFHYVTGLMWKIGMELVIDKSDEAYAYLIGYITEKVFDMIGKEHRKK